MLLFGQPQIIARKSRHKCSRVSLMHGRIQHTVEKRHFNPIRPDSQKYICLTRWWVSGCRMPVFCVKWSSFNDTRMTTASKGNGKYFPHYWPFVRGIPRSPVNSPHKGQGCGVLMFSLIWAWTNGWVNNQDAGDLRRHRFHYDDIVMDINYAGNAHLFGNIKDFVLTQPWFCYMKALLLVRVI